jgi:tRNA(Arg) A34 adenosine deaminase TadA
MVMDARRSSLREERTRADAVFQLVKINSVDAKNRARSVDPPYILTSLKGIVLAGPCHELRERRWYGKNRYMKSPFMARAIQLAIDSVQSDTGGPFGAVIVRNDAIVAEGANCVTSTKDPTAHAEVCAIRRACTQLGVFELKDCEIYTSCEPCPMCMGAIYWARIGRVYFASTAQDAAEIGFDDSLIYKELALPCTERLVPMVQMMREEAIRAFHAWSSKSDKIHY